MGERQRAASSAVWTLSSGMMPMTRTYSRPQKSPVSCQTLINRRAPAKPHTRNSGELGFSPDSIFHFPYFDPTETISSTTRLSTMAKQSSGFSVRVTDEDVVGKRLLNGNRRNGQSVNGPIHVLIHPGDFHRAPRQANAAHRESTLLRGITIALPGWRGP